MRGRHRPGYKPPGIRDPRKFFQPLLLDRLAPAVRRAVVVERSRGKSWTEITAIASKVAGRRLSANVCWRWYWLRHQRRGDSLQMESFLRVLSSAALRELARRGEVIERCPHCGRTVTRFQDVA